MFVGWGVTRSVSNRASADHGTDKRKMLRWLEMRSSARLGFDGLRLEACDVEIIAT